MGITYHKTINYCESDDAETARFSPSICIDNNEFQVIAVCPLGKRELSLIIYTKEKIDKLKFSQVFLVEKEVDMMIDALKEAKKRWNKPNNIVNEYDFLEE